MVNTATSSNTMSIVIQMLMAATAVSTTNSTNRARRIKLFPPAAGEGL